MMAKTKYTHIYTSLLGLTLFSLALWVLHRELAHYHIQDILQHAKSLAPVRVFWGLILTLLSYLIMTGYDLLALKYINHPLPYRKTAFASFAGYAFSNNIGLSMLAGGSVRFRLYTAWGLSVYEIGKVVLLCTSTLWLGFSTLAGIIFLLAPIHVPSAVHLPVASLRMLGCLALLPSFLYLTLNLLRKNHFKLFNHDISIPGFRLFGSQMAVALLDWFVAGYIFYILLPENPHLTVIHVLGVFLLAQLGGLASQIPGGLGVFETIVVLLLSPFIPTSSIVGSLLVYRGLYYILPLLVAAILLGLQELLSRRDFIFKLSSYVAQGASVIMPGVLVVTTFLGGVVLLLSGSTPAEQPRFAWFQDMMPLPVLETSHLLGSLAGMGLLILARGLQRRLDAAYLLAVSLLGVGVVVSLLKGFDYEEALLLAIILAALIPCRRFFYRKATIFDASFTPGWTVAVILALLCSAWLVSFSYKHVEYSHDLWWNFAISGHASRSLRALVGASGLALLFSLLKLLSPTARTTTGYKTEDTEKIAAIVRQSPNGYANLALLGDKHFLFSKNDTAFLMYGISGRSWIVMGDPIGPRGEWKELLWRFRELCDRYDVWPVFYEVGIQDIPLYLDFGLAMVKIGEEGRVDLGQFSLEGSANKGLRHTLNKFDKEGFVFEMVPVGDVAPLLPELKNISDQWMQEKNTREKSFSLGSFNELYLLHFPVAVVRFDGKPIAFSNLWQGAEKEDLSPDLMRYLPDAPNAIMDYLFIKLILWGKAAGYHWFSLGMAPFAGLEAHTLAPLWNRLGAFLFRHGENYYNFQGLRQYKQKFGPVWEPRYLVSPGGRAFPIILTNIATLISGGFKGVISK